MYINSYQPIIYIGQVDRMSANVPEDWNSISGRVKPKTQKRYLTPPFLTLNIIRFGSSRAIQGKK